MWMLFVPLLALVLLLFVLGSLFAGVLWIFGSGWPLLLVALGVWMFWQQDGRHYRRSRGWDRGSKSCGHARSRPRHQSVPDRSAPEAPHQSPRSPMPTPRPQHELPIDLQVKVEQIRRKVDVLLGYADRFPPFSRDLYLVQQTASDYLPRTLEAYLSLPAANVDRPLASGGRTARQELKTQLDLLDSKLDEIAQDLQRQDADRLLSNRRFLESRFGDDRARPFTVVKDSGRSSEVA